MRMSALQYGIAFFSVLAIGAFLILLLNQP
jgi:hypothetical protein